MENLGGHKWKNDDYRWFWKSEEWEIFMVKSCYKKLERLLAWEDTWSGEEKIVF